MSAFFLLVAVSTLHSALSIWFPRPLWSAPRVSSFFRVYSSLSSTPPRWLPPRLLLRQPRRAVKLSAFFLLAARLTLHSASSIWFPRPGWPRSTRLIFFPCFLLTPPPFFPPSSFFPPHFSASSAQQTAKSPKLLPLSTITTRRGGGSTRARGTADFRSPQLLFAMVVF